MVVNHLSLVVGRKRSSYAHSTTLRASEGQAVHQGVNYPEKLATSKVQKNPKKKMLDIVIFPQSHFSV